MVLQTVAKNLTPTDAGLQLNYIETTHETEVSTERVFMEDKIAETLQKLPGAKPMLTYFVNGINKTAISYKLQASSPNVNNELEAKSLKLEAGITYSFVSTLVSGLADNEIILNQWAADDLGATVGDSVRLTYFEIGPLRQLVEKESVFILKEIVPMTPVWADATRMPHLPGLSDAGHCREWEAGIPINMDAIRDKDEAYWNDFKGTPKAYVSIDKALDMWSNRFGNYTAVRFPSDGFSEEAFKRIFAENISPADLGMSVEPVREKGCRPPKTEPISVVCLLV